MSKRIFQSIFIFFLLLPFVVFAFQESGINNNLLATVNPTNPSPGDKVMISLTGYGFDLESSSINWLVNGLTKASGQGLKNFTFQLGRAGEQTKIEVYVESTGGQTASKTFVFYPTEIDFFWEAKTTKPAFYQGKSLPSGNSLIKIVAIPTLVNHAGQKINLGNLLFTWKKDGNPIDNSSGLGKNSVYITTNSKDSSQLKVSVTAASPDDNIKATKDLVINLVKPEIFFYEKRPLAGINYDQILSTEYSLFDQEVSVRAEPFFLPLSEGSDFKYFWTIDRSAAVGRPDDPLAITLRQSQGLSGSNRIGFSVQNSSSSANSYFIIKYGSGLLKPQN